MKSHYRFTMTKKIDGTFYEAGAVVPQKSIDKGCAISMLRLGEIEEVEAESEIKPAKPAPKK